MSILIGFVLLAMSAGLVGFPLMCAMVVSAACFFINLGCVRYSYRKQKRYMLYQAYSFFYLFQPLAFLTLLVIFPVETDEFITATTILKGNPFSLLVSFSLVPIIAAVFTQTLMVFSPRQPFENDYLATIRKKQNELALPLIVAAMLNFSAWFFDIFPLYISYFVRVLWAAFHYTAFLAGLCFSLKSKVTYIWLATLFAGLVLAGITGSRGYAFWPFLFYFIGFVIKLKPNTRFIIIIMAMMVTPFGIKYLGLIDTLRNEIGRTSVSSRDTQDLQHGIRDAISQMSTEGKNASTSINTTAFKGLRRLVDWSLVVVPSLSPEKVPYRGYWDINKEIGSMFYFGGFNLTSRWVRPYLSVMYARSYGFRVYKKIENGKVNSSSVPFNVVADSYSRYGVVSSIFQVFFYMAILTLVEKQCRKLFYRDSVGYLMVLTYLVGQAFYYSNVYNLTKNVRNMVMYVTFIVCMMKVYAFVMKVVGNGSQHSNHRIR
jgi:hypothetical protein